MNEIVFPKGTIAICPKCKLEMCIAMCDQISGEIAKSTDFKPINAIPKRGEPAICPSCGTSYGKNGSLYTKEGWKP